MLGSTGPASAKPSWRAAHQPSPVRQRMIPKPDGRGLRQLQIPTVTDRVILQAIQQMLAPRLDPSFSESSFGYRFRRSAHGAVKQVQRAIREGYRVAVDLDVEKFFDRVDFDILMARLGRHVPDQRLLRLIGRYLRAGVWIDGAARQRRRCAGMSRAGPPGHRDRPEKAPAVGDRLAGDPRRRQAVLQGIRPARRRCGRAEWLPRDRAALAAGPSGLHGSLRGTRPIRVADTSP
jgi:Reverse transcriptase (RNA-dependent DNA polymerase)